MNFWQIFFCWKLESPQEWKLAETYFLWNDGFLWPLQRVNLFLKMFYQNKGRKQRKQHLFVVLYLSTCNLLPAHVNYFRQLQIQGKGSPQMYCLFPSPKCLSKRHQRASWFPWHSDRWRIQSSPRRSMEDATKPPAGLMSIHSLSFCRNRMCFNGFDHCSQDIIITVRDVIGG